MKNVKTVTIDDVKEFFEKEYKEAEWLLDHPAWWVKPKETIDNAIKRCLGVAFFAQNYLEFAEIDDEYTKIKKDLENLLTK